MATTSGAPMATEQELAAASVLLSSYTDSTSELVEQIVDTSSDADLTVLTHLLAHPAQRPHELMAVTGLSRPGVAAVVARLERLGLVRRAFGPHDRRTTLASLTPAGRRRLANLERALVEHCATSVVLVEEILGLLGCDAVASVQRNEDADGSALAAIGRLSAAMGSYSERLDDDVRRLPARQRVAITTLLSWGPSRPTQLADALQLSSGGLTYVMDQLEAEGIVTRTYGQADDRRSVLVELSDRGREYGRSLCSALADGAPEICAALKSQPASIA